ncbi:MAG: hypothetical protein KAV82_00340 [Phycisphaerae bacterium]|nr:hypothetical protein [Phycisphaerae bacterium]
MGKELPHSLKALGREQLPETIHLPDGEFRFVRLFKHDFFAVTALYSGPGGKVVLKVGRKADFLGWPCGWIGRLLARHEAGIYQRLADLEAVPQFLGMWGKHGFVHAYVEGHPMQKGERVPDDFAVRLRQAIEAIHRRGMAYVDLEKPQNVIVGDDGRPHLIDFQISWYLSKDCGGQLWPARFVLRRLQEADRYHLAKLQRRTRSDQMTGKELAASYRKPWYIKLHKWLTHPATRFRRQTLKRLDPDRRSGERGAVP